MWFSEANLLVKDIGGNNSLCSAAFHWLKIWSAERIILAVGISQNVLPSLNDIPNCWKLLVLHWKPIEWYQLVSYLFNLWGIYTASGAYGTIQSYLINSKPRVKANNLLSLLSFMEQVVEDKGGSWHDENIFLPEDLFSYLAISKAKMWKYHSLWEQVLSKEQGFWGKNCMCFPGGTCVKCKT